MNIVIILPTLAMGGAERTAVSLANWLSENTNDNIVFINMGEENKNYEFNKKVKIYHNKHCNEGFIKRKINKFKYIYSSLCKSKPDVIFEMLYYPIKNGYLAN